MKSKIRKLAFFLAMFSLGWNVSFAGYIASSPTGSAWTWPGALDIACWTGVGSGQGNTSGRSEIPEVCITPVTSTGLTAYGAAALIPGVDNSNALGVQVKRWSDLEAVTATFGGNVTMGTYTSGVGVVPSTATYSQGIGYNAYLLNGALSPNVSAGSALCSTNTVVGQGLTVWSCPANLAAANFVGLAAVATSTGNVVNVVTSGFYQAVSSGTIAIGDLETTSSYAAGVLQTYNNVTSTSTVAGIALNTCSATASPCNTLIRLR